MTTTEITVNQQQDVVSVSLGEVGQSATINVTEVPEQVELVVQEITSPVLVDVTETSSPVTINVSEQLDQVIVSVYEGDKTFLFKAFAGENIEPFRLVYLANDGKLYKSTVVDGAIAHRVLGISLQNANTGAETYISTAGFIQYDGWAWNASLPLFLGLDGQITQSPGTTDAYWLQVGKVVKSNLIYLNIQEAVINGAT